MTWHEGRPHRTAAHGTLLLLALACSPAEAKKKPQTTWQVSRVTDPITGSTTCVVAATDRAAGLSFSRVGYLYPLVENNPVHGLLVGVSSGGQYRVPSGDIIWRVDDRPYRELKAADNPPTSPQPSQGSSEDPAARAMREAMALTSRLALAATATSTLASGERAKEMLAEMLAGQALLYRAKDIVPAYGLPSPGTYRVGQVTGDGLRPYPIDESFRAGLAACGIAAPT